MNVLIITPTYLPRDGGIENSILETAKKISEKSGNNVSIVTPFIDPNSKNYEKFGNLEIYRFGKFLCFIQNRFLKFSLFNLTALFYLFYLKIFKKFNFDVINTHTVALPGIPSVVLSKIFKKPLVFSIHHYGSGMDIVRPEENGYLLNKLIKKLLKYADFITVTSETQEKYLDYLFGGKKKDLKYFCVPLGINMPEISNSKNISNNGQFIVFTIGRLVKRKRLDIILNIAERLSEDKKIVFAIAGSGPEKENLEKMILEKDLKNVILLGRVTEEEKVEWFSKSNLFIQSSEYEGFGITYLEGLSFGIPVLAFKNTAIEEIKRKIGKGVYIFEDVDSAVSQITEIKSSKLDSEIIQNKIRKTYS